MKKRMFQMNKICKNPLFDFHLDLIEDCQVSHDEQGKIRPAWFYLTCGYYRIAAGHDLLLNYSNSLVDQWKQNPSVHSRIKRNVYEFDVYSKLH